MGVQVAVSYGESCREVAAQLLQQLREGSLLGRRASVSREAFAVQSPFVADADAVAVVTEAVRPLQGERPAGMYPAVACDVVMVADVAEVPAVDMVTAAILERVRLPAAIFVNIAPESAHTASALRLRARASQTHMLPARRVPPWLAYPLRYANTCREPTEYIFGSHQRSSRRFAISFRSFLP